MGLSVEGHQHFRLGQGSQSDSLASSPRQALCWCLSAPHPQRQCSLSLVPSWHLPAAACHHQPCLLHLPCSSPSVAVVSQHLGSPYRRARAAADSGSPSRGRQQRGLVPTSLLAAPVASPTPAGHQQAVGSLQHWTSASRVPHQCSPDSSPGAHSSQGHDATRLAPCGDRHQEGLRRLVSLAQRQAAFSQQSRVCQPVVSQHHLVWAGR